MDGYSSNGNAVIINIPASIITSDITIASFGRFINKFPELLSIIYFPLDTRYFINLYLSDSFIVIG